MRVGLTGGIASGKSTASQFLKSFGATIIDYDVLARDVVAPGSRGLELIIERFGPEVVGPDGTLDRPALGAIVFADEQARRDLEGITHPAIGTLVSELEKQAGPDAVVVHDNPLLIEMGQYAACDEVIVIDVPVEVQRRRLIDNRQMAPEDADARIAAQASREQRRAVATIIVENTGTTEELGTKLREVWAELSS